MRRLPVVFLVVAVRECSKYRGRSQRERKGIMILLVQRMKLLSECWRSSLILLLFIITTTLTEGV